MAAGNYNFKIEQGSTFVEVLTWRVGQTPVDLTGFTAKMQLRNDINSGVLLELTTENGRIALGGTAGTITINLPAADTALLTFEKAVYDLQLISPDNVVTRLLKGHVTIDPEVTR